MAKKITKFTKAIAYAFLKELGDEVSFATSQDKAKFLAEVKENFEPQAGGGASKNPSYRDEETGEMMHYCRFKQCYMPEHMMNMHAGKSKGASRLAAKHDYELGKKYAELKDEALKLFTAGDYTGGAAKNLEADELNASRSNPETFSDENLAYLKEWEERENAKKNNNTVVAETTSEEV